MSDIIVIKKQNKERRAKRASVVVQPQTYIKVYETAQLAGMSVEKLVDILLTDALQRVKIEE